MVEKAFNLIFELNAVPLYKAEYYIENYIDICVNRWKKKRARNYTKTSAQIDLQNIKDIISKVVGCATN